MNDPLAPLLADGVIDEVVARLKSGKEADVWLVRSGGHVVAAKVYKARQTRSFKNDAAYREGRQVRNTRTQRAMDRGSRFGQAASEEAWKAKESDALHRLHAAGVRVPRPVIFYEGVLLMELVVDAHGHPAPRLVDAHLAREQAAALYADLRRQAIGMLACDLIHGDLSPYNVLAGAEGPVVIDFPQVVGAAHNSQAERFFLRDLENVRRFCAALDPALGAAEGDGREIWRAYVRRELTADFVPRGVAHGGGAGDRGRRHEGPRDRQQQRPPKMQPQPQHTPRHKQPSHQPQGQQPRPPREPPPRQHPPREQQHPPHPQTQRQQGPPRQQRPAQQPPQQQRQRPGGPPRDPGARRGAPAPEVIRVERPLARGSAAPVRPGEPRPHHGPPGPGRHPHGGRGRGGHGGGHGGHGGGQGGHGGRGRP